MDDFEKYLHSISENIIITEDMKNDFVDCELNLHPRNKCDSCSWYGKLIKSPKENDYIPLCAIEEIGNRIRNECEGILKGE